MEFLSGTNQFGLISKLSFTNNRNKFFSSSSLVGFCSRLPSELHESCLQ